MQKNCSERDRLKEVYYHATLEASVLSGALETSPFGREFSVALEKAKSASLACNAARRAYREHCKQHGCEDEFYEPLRQAAS